MTHSFSIFILLILFLCVSPYIVQAVAETFTIQASDSVTRTVKLSEGDEAYGRITVIGVEGLGVTFRVINPEGVTIKNQQEKGLQDFHLTATQSGVYTFLFENLETNDVQVSFNYNVRHYILGIPQELFLVLVIVGLVMASLVVFFALSPKA